VGLQGLQLTDQAIAASIKNGSWVLLKNVCLVLINWKRSYTIVSKIESEILKT
jgi:hypothetical protein